KERDSAGTIIDFPDDSTYARYQRRGGVLSRDDWRRQNVDLFVQQLYRGVKQTKRWVKFGVSPIGTWRPGNPETIKGFDAYAEIYADSKRWLNNGWLDYFTPQLYWPIARTEVSYPVLLKWWVSQNMKARNIWPGNYTGRVGRPAPDGWMTQEILDQIALTRSQPGATGNIHFSARAFMQSKDSLVERLISGPYSGPALVPTSRWLDSIPPLSPRITVRTDSATRAPVVRMVPRGATKVWLWVVRSRSAGAWTTVVLPGWMRSHMFATDAKPEFVYVSTVDRVGNESRATKGRHPPTH
ncbi:MAG TPA: family 10 glycosylhydrolase, partial [Gemmatimonadaceae bacterium]